MKDLAKGSAIALFTFAVGLGLATLTARPYAERALREAVLRQDLREMRKAIDQYAVDQESFPPRLNDLVIWGYIRELPIDPFTNRADWEAETGEPIGPPGGGRGIVGVHSSAAGLSLSGLPFRDF